MKKIINIILAVLLSIGILLSAFNMPHASAASLANIDTAIAKGLAYLASTQGADGGWHDNGFPVASTAMAVLAFENDGNLPGGSSTYHTNVEKGLDYLLSQAQEETMILQDGNNPDSNGNTKGIWFSDFGKVYNGYETGMVLMALVASQSQLRTATNGPESGRNYHDIAVDIVDWLAYAQTDSAGGVYEGGWRYWGNYGSSDNSVTGWPILGLSAAELWGINAPAWVKTELMKWLTTTQELTGNPTTNSVYGAFMYDPNIQYHTVVDTASGIQGLTYCGVTTSDPRMVAAEGYLVRDWSTSSNWNVNFNDLYAMYGVMKAMRLTQPIPTAYIVDYTGTPTIEWYNGANQYADWLVNNQYTDGHWWGSINPDSAGGYNLDTAWGTLILEFVPITVTYTLTVNVIEAVTLNPIVGASISAVGPETRSGNTGVGGQIIFSALQAGSYDVSATASGYSPSGSQTVLLVSDKSITISLQPIILLTPGKVTGGGQITIPIPNAKAGKATFAFNAQYQQGDSSPKGELQYTDHTTKMDVHSTDIKTIVVSPDETKATFTGTCTINKAGGLTFNAYLEDNGEPGKADVFKITVSNGYTAGGIILNGNIQIHKTP